MQKGHEKAAEPGREKTPLELPCDSCLAQLWGRIYRSDPGAKLMGQRLRWYRLAQLHWWATSSVGGNHNSSTDINEALLIYTSGGSGPVLLMFLQGEDDVCWENLAPHALECWEELAGRGEGETI